MKPILLTAGDPNGVGPEIVLKCLDRNPKSNIVVIGEPEHFASAAKDLGITFDLPNISSIPVAADIDGPSILPIRSDISRKPGRFDPRHAKQIVEVLRTATELCLSGKADGIVTAPVNKAVLKEGARFEFPGHTEFLAHQCDVKTPVMMLVAPELRTVPTTIHIPLKSVPSALSPDLLKTTVEVTEAGLRKQFGIDRPRLVVAGLNPHAGENGKIGTEELEWIDALVASLRENGTDISGPYPADTLFHASRRKTYDAAICMYHDQALIPVKTIGFDDGVNVTLGLPFVRTSPDHGTAFDIAGTGNARPDSFIAAFDLAQSMIGSS